MQHDLLSDYVEIQDVYGKRDNVFSPKRTTWNRKSIFGYRAVRTRSEMFVRRNDGKEFYYVLPSKYNRIDKIDSSENIRRLRELTGNKTMDVFQNDFFAKVRIFYKTLPFAEKRNRILRGAIEEKLRELFRNITSGKKMAFRCGGEHTWELIKIIPDEFNIQYIIDINRSAVTNIPGYRYIAPKEISDEGIDMVIW